MDSHAEQLEIMADLYEEIVQHLALINHDNIVLSDPDLKQNLHTAYSISKSLQKDQNRFSREQQEMIIRLLVQVVSQLEEINTASDRKIH